MATRFYGLPPLTSLAVFEATARHLSMKDAAAELNVTPGAVSHQIKALEQDIAVSLFRRIHRGIELTPEGEELYDVLARAFNHTATVLDRLRSGDVNSAVTIGATTAVASLWLMPRITAFWRQHPDIRVNHRISDTPFDLKRADVDLAIRYGRGNWPGEEAAILFDDEIIPVASPEFAKRHAGIGGVELPGLPLIQMEALNRSWMTWSEWFRDMGIPAGRLNGPRFNNYSISLQAAADGIGVGLCWRHLSRPFLISGELVHFTGLSLPAAGHFCLTWSNRDNLSPSGILVRDWLLHESGRDQPSLE